jgi:hypothetical protein
MHARRHSPKRVQLKGMHDMSVSDETSQLALMVRFIATFKAVTNAEFPLVAAQWARRPAQSAATRPPSRSTCNCPGAPNREAPARWRASSGVHPPTLAQAVLDTPELVGDDRHARDQEGAACQ